MRVLIPRATASSLPRPSLVPPSSLTHSSLPLPAASTVQFLPMPVVGGYLAYIGFFCGQAGLALMANVEIVHLVDWR